MTASEIITQAQAAADKGQWLRLGASEAYFTPEEIIEAIEVGGNWGFLQNLVACDPPAPAAIRALPPESLPCDAFDAVMLDMIPTALLMLLLGGIAAAFGFDAGDCFDRIFAAVTR